MKCKGKIPRVLCLGVHFYQDLNDDRMYFPDRIFIWLLKKCKVATVDSSPPPSPVTCLVFLHDYFFSEYPNFKVALFNAGVPFFELTSHDKQDI